MTDEEPNFFQLWTNYMNAKQAYEDAEDAMTEAVNRRRPSDPTDPVPHDP